MTREIIELWQRQMRAAASEQALLAAVAQYLAALSHEDLQRLPAGSRPGPLTRGEDIAALNVQLVREELMFTGDAKTAALLRGLVAVLREASHRLAQISVDR